MSWAASAQALAGPHATLADGRAKDPWAGSARLSKNPSSGLMGEGGRRRPSAAALAPIQGGARRSLALHRPRGRLRGRILHRLLPACISLAGRGGQMPGGAGWAVLWPGALGTTPKLHCGERRPPLCSPPGWSREHTDQPGLGRGLPREGGAGDAVRGMPIPQGGRGVSATPALELVPSPCRLHFWRAAALGYNRSTRGR